MFKRDLVLFRSARLFSSSAVGERGAKKRSVQLEENELSTCPICQCPYDNQKHKRLIDTTCEHEKCYSCMFKYEQCSICLSNLVENRSSFNSSSLKAMPSSSSPSTIIANNLLVQASPPSARSTGQNEDRRPTTPTKPVSQFQKLLHHFNGSKSSFIRGTSLNSSQSRSSMKSSTVMKNVHSQSETRTDDALPPPPPPEFAHEQLLDILLQGNRTRISSLSPSPSTSSATTHTSLQRLIAQPKKATHENISPSMSNSDLSFSPSAYESIPMNKSQTSASVRYISTPSSTSPSNQTCPCGSILKEDLHDEQKYAVDRHWIYDEMFKLLKATSKPGLVLLSRSSGMGKTCLLKRLVSPCSSSIVQRSDSSSMSRLPPMKRSAFEWFKSHILSSHFCDPSQISSCALPDMIHSIIYRALEHPLLHAYRDVILREQHTRKAITLNACIQNVEHAFFTAFLDQLNQLKQLGHLQEFFAHSNHVYLLLDAIDHEQCDSEGPTITEFLFRNLQRFPPWLKLIITMNRLDNELCQQEQNRFLEHFVLFDFDDQGRWKNFLHNDIREYLSKRLENDASNDLYDLSSSNSNIEQLCLLSEGNLFFIQQLCDLIDEREYPAHRDLPRTIEDIFAYRYSTKKIHEHRDVSRAVLEICLATRRPININILYNCLNIDEDLHLDWTMFLQSLSALSAFLTQYPNSTYAISHSPIRQWLLAHPNDYFACNVKKGHTRLALYLSRSFTASLHGPEAMEFLRHLSFSHLFQENFTGICQRIRTLIDDPSRLLASLRNAFYPELDLSELLLIISADPDAVVDSIHMPLLCIAAQHGYLAFVTLLLKYQANVNLKTKNNENKTALMYAAEHGHEDVLKLLLQSNADITLKDKHQLTALAYATKHLNLLRLFPSCDAWIEQQAFVYAASIGSLAALQWMLTERRFPSIEINGIDSIHGETALTSASSHGHMTIIDYLINQHHADIDRVNARQMTPLLLAVKNGMWSAVEYLLDHQASIEHCDQQKRTCLIIAASEGHLAVIDSLLEKGANVHHQDEEGLTALSWACLKGHYHACETLLTHGSDVNHEDINGRIPIDMASFYGDVQLVQLLIDHGSVIDHVDKNGMRALDRAIGCRNVAVVNCLLKKSVKLGPSTWALAAGKSDMMIILISKLIDDGISLYKKNHYKDAAYRFSYALKKIPVESSEQFSANFRLMKYNCLMNLAKCKRKLESFDAAVDACSQALAIEETADALLLRSRIKRDQKLYDDALADLLAAKSLDPNNTDLDRYINRLQNDLQQCHETLL